MNSSREVFVNDMTDFDLFTFKNQANDMDGTGGCLDALNAYKKCSWKNLFWAKSSNFIYYYINKFLKLISEQLFTELVHKDCSSLLKIHAEFYLVKSNPYEGVLQINTK